MKKPTVHYLKDYIQLGFGALIKPIDHPKAVLLPEGE